MENWTGYVLALGMFLVACIQTICLQHNFQLTYVIGMRIRTAIIGAIYRKVGVLYKSRRRAPKLEKAVHGYIDDRFQQGVPVLSLLREKVLKLNTSVVYSPYVPFLWAVFKIVALSVDYVIDISL